LSDSYYSSVACLNEMGASWIIESDHTIIFTPDFNLDSPDFQNGALDPREIGFYINNQERVLGFIELLRDSFDISKNAVLINQKVNEFLKIISGIKPEENNNIRPKKLESVPQKSKEEKIKTIVIENPSKKEIQSSGYYTRFLADIDEGKLKDEELLLIKYIIDTTRVKLGTGWQEDHEVQNIKEWEDINGLNNNLSLNYSSAIRRFDLRRYTEVSAYTSSGNPKEVCLTEEIQEKIIDFPEKLLNILDETTTKNIKKNEFDF